MPYTNMPPWKGFKSKTGNNHDTRWRNTLVGPQLPRHSDQLPRRKGSLDDAGSNGGEENRPQELGNATSSSSTDAAGPQGDGAAGDANLRPVRTNSAPKHHRFSLLKFRHASDPQLSSSYAAAEAPPVPALPTPTIITTSPTSSSQTFQPQRQRKKAKLLTRPQPLSSDNLPRDKQRLGPFRNKSSPDVINHALREDGIRKPHVSFEDPPRLSSTSVGGPPPPAYGDESNSSLALPLTRLSESSRSDGSSGDNGIYATTTTTHTVHTTTTFFKLPRRKKDKGPLFPLPVRITPPAPSNNSAEAPRPSVGGRSNHSPERPSLEAGSSLQGLSGAGGTHQSPLPSPTHSALALTNAPTGTPGPTIVRKDSINSHRSGNSGSRMAPPLLGHRGRSSTMGSVGRDRDGQHTPSGLVPSGRTSTSTVGRKSFGDLFSLSTRLRYNSENPDRFGSPSGIPGTPGSISSKPNSFSLPRESLSYPPRGDDDTPAGYLEKLEQAVNRGVIASILCKSADDFSKTCLRKYMRSFSYFTDSIDMAVRKMLMEVELPKETQQIDRLLQGFADRYCECNPGIFVSTDEAYFVAFSILLLHSDTHNKNNKRKMQRQDYVKNTQDQVEVSQDILECFYDNVSYTPFIHFDDEVAINSHRLANQRSKKNLFKATSSDTLKGPVDPYALILDNKLEQLRPSLKNVVNTEDIYSVTGTAPSFDVGKLHQTFLKSGILQIVSARSRPDAFLTPATTSNPADAQAGLVDIKAAKVGVLWRKDPKKKKARSPWQEWGAILTSSQLYFFRDLAWIKTLMTQQQNHTKNGNVEHPVVFRPPLTDFKPDALMSMDDSVALRDETYKKHKNAFIFIKHGGFEEVFLANDEADMNDWISRLNYAATFRTAGIRMRGVIGTNYEGRRRSITRDTSTLSEKTIPTATGEVSVQTRKFDQHIAREVMTYRRQLMMEKINEANEKLGSAQKELDNLLRNARHLLVMCPIQQRTRESLVYAAGKMSAKLKWTRVEMSRTKCHCDILRLDMEDEERKHPQLLGREPSLSAASPQLEISPSQVALAKIDSAQSNAALSPKSTKSESRRPFSFISPSISTLAEPQAPRRSSLTSRRSSHASLTQSPAVTAATADLKEDFITPQSTPNLAHRPSTISGRSRSENTAGQIDKRSVEEAEEQVLRDAGLVGLDGTTPSSPHLDNEAKSLESKSSEPTPNDKTKNRSSLRRTLRDSHGSLGHNRSRKGRDSSSGATMADDKIPPKTAEAESLARGTGSFIVHGKKASVITFGQDWNIMSPEERLKMKREMQRSSMKSTKDDAESNASLLSADIESGREGSFKSIPERSLSAALSDDQSSIGQKDYFSPDPASVSAMASMTENKETRSNGDGSRSDEEDVVTPTTHTSPTMKHGLVPQAIYA